jgi:hypothetical protein
MPHQHKYEWDGYAMVAAVRRQRFEPGQKSGLLTAERTGATPFVQDPDETPRQFWQRVLKDLGDTCEHCGAPLGEARP